MKLAKEDVQEFVEIYQREYGIELSPARSETIADRVLGFHEVILRILVKHHNKRPLS